MKLIRVSMGSVVVFVAIWGCFAALTFLLILLNQGFGPAVVSGIGSISGPMTGALSRNFQKCCYEFSAHLTPFFLPLLGIAIFSQMFVGKDESVWRDRFRLTAWIFGWVGWFFGGLVSFLHALS